MKAQIEFVSFDVTSAGQTDFKKNDSSFGCFEQCIKDTTCKFVSRIHPHTYSWSDCYKKPSTVSSSTTAQDAQYAKIKGIYLK